MLQPWLLSVVKKRHQDQGNLGKEALGWVFTVSESLAVVAGNVVVVRHGAGAVANSSHLICK